MPTSEQSFLDAIKSLPSHPASRGLMDDAAVLEMGEQTLVITHDSMAEGVHFLPSQDMTDVAYKLVATNLSDLAAKGAQPLGILLGYALGKDDDRFLVGLNEALREFGCTLLGGDTISGNSPRSFGLTALGIATHNPVPSRGGATEGDALYITGPVGAAMLGFEALSNKTGADSESFRRPKPLLKEGQLLAPIVTAIMDVSDGLLLDASRIASSSNTTLAIETAMVPLAAPEERRADALRWGDDYQLLFTAPRELDLPILAYRIGSVTQQGSHPILLDGIAPDPEDTLGYRH